MKLRVFVIAVVFIFYSTFTVLADTVYITKEAQQRPGRWNGKSKVEGTIISSDERYVTILVGDKTIGVRRTDISKIEKDKSAQDIVYLKHKIGGKKKYEGKIMKVTEDSVTIFSNGTPCTFQKSLVEEIKRGGAPPKATNSD